MEQPAEQRLQLTHMTLTLGLGRTERAMATECTISVIGANPPAFIDRGLSRVADLEQLWSRFVNESDISRINRAHGEPTAVSIETRLLVTFMKTAHVATGGAFNPTLLTLQMAAGDITSLGGHILPPLPESTHAWDHLDELVVTTNGAVVAPSTMVLDPGGIGKGLAADIVARELVDAGADAACVNIGGDLRIVRRSSCGQSWPVTISSPHDVEIGDERLSLLDGAVATSDRAARRRADGTVPRHHFSSDGSYNDVVGATIVAAWAAWAEAWTKHAMTRPVADTLHALDNHGLAGRVVVADGTVHRTSTWHRFVS